MDWLKAKKQKSNTPKEDIKVNREFDEHGNLIRFDSTYTYNWLGDTTLNEGAFPKNFGHIFNGEFKHFNDSSFLNHFDQTFSGFIGIKSDSSLMKKFGREHFHFFNFDEDTLVHNFNQFDDYFGQLNLEKPDSIPFKSGKIPFQAKEPSMQEIMKMMQRQMQEMEDFQKQFYRKSQDKSQLLFQ